MSSLLVINADGPETRVALVEDGLLGELYIERKRERGIAGNIYKGRVERVLPGRHLVFMPTVDHIGISRRIASDRERRRLRDIVESMRPPGSGFIVRTVAEGISEKELKSDMEFLIKLWNEIVKRSETGRCPALIYNDLDLLLRTVRDMFTPDVEKLIIDSRSEYDR